jgi:electron transfer flavoprotein alpha subunit
MEQANVVIAINSDKNAPIFEYADYGVVASVEEVLEEYERNSN